jgi:hypothetical protein
MRLLLALAVVIVFAALMMFDTAALLRLVGFCVTGGCGVSPLWIAVTFGALVLAAVVWPRRPAKPAPKVAKARKTPASGPRRNKAAAPGKAKRTRKPGRGVAPGN